MGFSNKQETNLQPAPIPGEEAVLARIAFLGEKQAELEAGMAEFNAVTQDVSSLRAARDLAISELEAVRTESARLLAEISEQTEKLAQITTLCTSKKSELELASILVVTERARSADLSDISNGVKSEIAGLEAQRADLLSMLADKLEEKLGLERDLESLKAEASSVSAEMTTKKNAAIAELDELSGRFRAESEKLQALESQTKTIECGIVDAKDEASRILSEARSESAGILERARAFEADLILREGDVSLKEVSFVEKAQQIEKAKAYLVEKTEDLRKAKAEFAQVRVASSN